MEILLELRFHGIAVTAESEAAFAIDVLGCPHGGARRKLLGMPSDGVVGRKFLDRLGLSSAPPGPARSRVGEALVFGA